METKTPLQKLVAAAMAYAEVAGGPATQAARTDLERAAVELQCSAINLAVEQEHPFAKLYDSRVVDALMWVAQNARGVVMANNDDKEPLRVTLKQLDKTFALPDRFIGR